MKIESGQKLLMTGDSITDADRSRPVGEGSGGGLGKGYVSLVDALIMAQAPALGIRIINQGCSGFTVRDLRVTWEEHVVAHKPDWLSVMIGINDVWRQFDSPLQVERHVHPEEYEATLEELVARALPSVKGMVLMTPYYIEPNLHDPMRVQMDRYGAIVRGIAQKYGTLFVDTQAAFDTVLNHCHPMTLAWDRIHPNLAGHMIIAQAFLRGIGFMDSLP